MKKTILIALTILSTCAFAQQATPQNSEKPVRKIKIKHADPMLIALILSGKITFTTPPEISTVIKKP
jgi:hypothetical protein